MNKINDEINFIHSLTDHNNNNHHNNDNDHNNNNNNHPLLHHLPSLEQYQDRIKLISSSMKTSLKNMFFDNINKYFQEIGWNYDQLIPSSLSDPPFVVSPEKLILTLQNIYNCLNTFIENKLKIHKDILYIYMNEFYNLYQYNIYDYAFINKDEIEKYIEESYIDYSSMCPNNNNNNNDIENNGDNGDNNFNNNNTYNNHNDNNNNITTQSNNNSNHKKNQKHKTDNKKNNKNHNSQKKRILL
jgi:hypothetical protein